MRRDAFDIFPAIDLLDGQSVRLQKGQRASAHVVAEDPLEQLRSYASAGARWVHIVNLNAAFGDIPSHEGALKTKALLANLIETGARERLGLRFQVGGGVRSERVASDLAEHGVDRVVLGTWALKAPDEVAGLARSRPGFVAVGLDALHGKLQLQGWTQADGGADLVEVAKGLAAAGIEWAVYTQIERDGMLAGVDVAAMEHLAEHSGLRVIASGGVSGPEDIKALSQSASKGVCGVIIGKALHAGRLQLSEALRYQT